MTSVPPSFTGSLFVLAAPSGAGKTSLVRALLERDPAIRLSVSYTTRSPRKGEQNGVHYHFVDVPTFESLRQKGEFLEEAEVYGNYYATSSSWLKKELSSGKDVLLEIDWQGAAQVRRLFRESIQIFVLPPSLSALKARLEARGQDSPEVIAKRMAAAQDEFSRYVDFDYVIMNDDFGRACDDLTAIIRSSRLRSERQRICYDYLLHKIS
ncbi:MAG: guanylate kinase [Burkholderiales bacterium]|jgi:guanylate kinase|nr:guanylate kinase [Burkholderiales bacterium]